MTRPSPMPHPKNPTADPDAWLLQALSRRGLVSTIRALSKEASLSSRTTRADYVVQYFLNCVGNFDLDGLLQVWLEFDERLFRHLGAEYSSVGHRLLNRILKLYLVNAWQNSQKEKIDECLSRIASDRRIVAFSAEFRDWYVLPFTKHAETDRIFQLYFSKAWRDVLHLSLFNFYSSVFLLIASELHGPYPCNATNQHYAAAPATLKQVDAVRSSSFRRQQQSSSPLSAAASKQSNGSLRNVAPTSSTANVSDNATAPSLEPWEDSFFNQPIDIPQYDFHCHALAQAAAATAKSVSSRQTASSTTSSARRSGLRRPGVISRVTDKVKSAVVPAKRQ